jgi:hypothetical protein
MKGTCTFCGRGVANIESAAYPVTGWEIEREGGGANRIADRVRVPDVIAHSTCLESDLARKRRGIARGQMDLGGGS